MDTFSKLFARGIWFAKNNPQIIYTLFLVIAIPAAFFYTSENFLRVASDNQDRLERSKISLLEDAFVAMFPGSAADGANSADINKRIAVMGAENETISKFDVLAPTSTVSADDGVGYQMFASLKPEDAGTLVTPDEVSNILIKLAKGDESQSFAMGYNNYEGRHWRSVRAFTPMASSAVQYFAVVDVSMAQADAVSERNIRNAYIVLAIIILLIIVLLARQARIIDYSTLYARLKEVDRMKDDFVSMAAHELRSPLTIIRGYVEMLGDGEGLTDAGKKHLKNIDQSALSLNALVGDILDVAKLQEGRMSFKLEDFDPTETIATVCEGFTQPAKDKGLTLATDLSATAHITVDPERFRQVMVNLIGNAVKYTPSGSVRVATELARGVFSVRVSDTGMGISSEDQKHLFEKFFRVKSEETARIQGTGLGLWITNHIVSQMSGSISVESIKSKGTDFIVSFPMKG